MTVDRRLRWSVQCAARVVAARVGAWWLAAVEPLRPIEETPNAAMKSAVVAMRIRRGVSHVR